MKLMAIANLTDNSFVRGDRMGELSFDALAESIGILLSDGADIVDIGACSTAPGNPAVSTEQEWKRLERALPVIFESFPDAVFSLDSFRPGIISKAIDIAGDLLHDIHEQFIVNDISSSLPELAVSYGVQYVAMADTPDPYAFFQNFALRAKTCGLSDWILDPGFGFGKTLEENWDILNNLERLSCFGRPILAALSRKRMVYQKFGLTPDSCAEQSVSAERLAIAGGASIIRTHDIKAHSSILRQISR